MAPWHVPGSGRYLQLRKAQERQRSRTWGRSKQANGTSSTSKLTGAQRKAVQKEVGSIERRLGKLAAVIEGLQHSLIEHDQSDYTGLQRYGDELREAEDEVEALEERWLELSDQLD